MSRRLPRESVDEPDPRSPSLVAVPSDTPLPEGISGAELESLLAVGRMQGELTQGDVIEAVHGVELTAEAIEQLVEWVKSNGIAFVEDVPDDAVDEDPEAALEVAGPAAGPGGAVDAGRGTAAGGAGAKGRRGVATSRPAARESKLRPAGGSDYVGGARPRTRSTPTSRRSARSPC